MTYTLAMAAEQGIEIAADGVAEVSMTKARALLTGLIRDVRWGRKVGAFTERGDRTAYVVTPDFYEQAKRDRALIELLEQRAKEPPEDAPALARMKAHELHLALAAANRDLDF